MRLLKLKGFVSGLGASLVLGIGLNVGSAVANPTKIKTEAASDPSASIPHLQQQKTIQPSVKLVTPAYVKHSGRSQPVKQTDLDSQRKNLAENPMCSLASKAVEDAPAVFKNAIAAQTPSKFSGFVSGFLRKLLQVMGFDRLIEQQTVPIPKITVIPKPLSDPENISATNAVQSSSAVRLVSNIQPQQSDVRQDYQLWVKGHPIANIRSQDKANLLAQRIGRLIDTVGFNPEAIAPTIYQNQPAIAMGGQILFIVDESVTREDIINHEILAIQWANNLRLAFNAPALDLITAQQEMYQIEETKDSVEGLASWYGPYFHGRQTANGEIYNQYAFTAAHPSMPLNTYLKITNLNNEKSVIIRLNDRGPYIEPRSLDLSLGAARCLGSEKTGVIPYKATIMKRHPAIATEAI